MAEVDNLLRNLQYNNDSKTLQDLLVALGVVLKGHFVLSSGLHSETYVQCARLFMNPRIAGIVCQALARKTFEDIRDAEFDLVVSAALGGMLLGYELSRQLGIENVFCERNAQGVFELRRSFAIPNKAKILVAEDVVTTGGSALEVINCLEPLDCEVVGVCSIIDRSGPEPQFPCPFTSLLKLDIAVYHPDNLPASLAATPITKPGSRFKR